MGKSLSLFRTSGDVFAKFDEMANKIFNEAFGGDFELTGGYPKLNVLNEPTGLTINAGVPGLTKDDIEVDWCNGCLTIHGGSVVDKTKNDKDYVYRELHRSSFNRTMSVDERIFDVEKISAEVKDGLLTVRIPKLDISTKEIKKVEIKG